LESIGIGLILKLDGREAAMDRIMLGCCRIANCGELDAADDATDPEFECSIFGKSMDESKEPAEENEAPDSRWMGVNDLRI
jgi:hypothetical protein